jgi:hypothetical protein
MFEMSQKVNRALLRLSMVILRMLMRVRVAGTHDWVVLYGSLNARC